MEHLGRTDTNTTRTWKLLAERSQETFRNEPTTFSLWVDFGVPQLLTPKNFMCKHVCDVIKSAVVDLQSPHSEKVVGLDPLFYVHVVLVCLVLSRSYIWLPQSKNMHSKLGTENLKGRVRTLCLSMHNFAQRHRGEVPAGPRVLEKHRIVEEMPDCRQGRFNKKKSPLACGVTNAGT